MKKSYKAWLQVLGLSVLLLDSCKDDESKLFTKLTSGRTGINFRNILRENEQANVLQYTYFYNGGGVAIGDINNDGLPDILFTGNMVPNRLFLNKGNFVFEDITEKSGIARYQGWCTGATMADVNGDGKLDIYICRSGDINPEKRKNLLFINNGDLTFTEEAEKYGLADEGYSTQAAFFDYDKDGDLDMILINHSLKQYATGAYENSSLRNEKNTAFGTKLYRNDNGHFTDVSEQAGIRSNVLNFGLGLSISDLNNDGWPDIYTTNDFNEPDHLFINNGNGTFSDKTDECLDQLSFYSMGSDCADINNDGLTDLITMDMLDEDNHSQKMHSGAENFNKFQMLFKKGFYYQYSRNMLHTNNGDGTFSEIAQLAGVSNTSWSWAPLFCDFDNDGNKDLFISNGYEKDFTNMDFIKYRVAEEVKTKHGEAGPSTMEMLEKMPALKMSNFIYRNNGNNSFTKKTAEWGFSQTGVASGAAFADLDNDGAMDLVVNNVNGDAGIYRNNAHTLVSENHYLKIKLNGRYGNSFGIGAKVKLYCGSDTYYQEQFPVRGFQSSVDPVLNFGIGIHALIDSVIVVWPDDRMQKIRRVKPDQSLILDWQNAIHFWKYDSLSTGRKYFTADQGPDFTHIENEFNDFSVQSLMPNFLSRQGPCIAAEDINGDGRKDLFIGGAKGQPGRIFIQEINGDFAAKSEPAIEKDSASEDVSAAFFDANGDGFPDLYIASGGYEFKDGDSALQDRIYFNDGKGNFKKNLQSLPQLRFSKSCVKFADINGDGAPDIFLGGRVVSGKYPLSPGSRILINDGKGNFRDATAEICPALLQLGMVTDALWIDLNGDHQMDLIVVGEWMPIKVFINNRGKLEDKSSDFIKFPSSGWWNCIIAEDFDGDGDLDLVIGNMGLNTQFKASEKEPLSLYYKDFENKGTMDPILCYYINGISYPAASRDDLTDQLPTLKKKFLEYNSYADATIHDIFSEDQLKGSGLLKAEMMQTIYLENRGKQGFVLKQLPLQVQYAPVYAISVVDANHDGKKDLVLSGNNSWTRIKFGRYRANHGELLINDGKGNFTYVPQAKCGLNIRDDIRSSQIILCGKKIKALFGANNDRIITYTLNKN
ncbi:MAG TPA: VCBS repeat-containing protein [Puia sp.]|nr:VCBS repeat-containing protein [Puia sp.]